jgi:Protein of unknown function (DUF3991)/Toprim-like
MTSDRRARADRLRAVPLEHILTQSGARPDPHDPCKWHTARGVLSVRGAKFFNWHRGTGGGGAIDLVIHLHQLSFHDALRWLQQHAAPSTADPPPSGPPSPLRLPRPAPGQLHAVRRYLIDQRALPDSLVDALVQSGDLYADARANAVFLLRDVSGQPVGAELRGTGPVPWLGLAPGSRKNLGFFSFPPFPRPNVILCESAIDALSCHVLHPEHRCLSTAGARPNPAWIPQLLHQDCRLWCGFDLDSTGQGMADAMMAFHPSIQRLPPPLHDWNDLLRARSRACSAL